MNKKTALLLSATLLMSLSTMAYAAEGITRETIPVTEELTPPVSVTVLEYQPELYPSPVLSNAIASYKARNYTGAAQELLSYLKDNPYDAKAFYYLATTLSNLGDNDAAIEAYEKVISLNPNEDIVMFAAKGRDCLIGGPLCATSELMMDEGDPLDEFINAPYGDGFSPELRDQMRARDLQNIQKNINRKPELSPDDVQEIRDFDKNNSEANSDLRIAMADGNVSNDEIVSALDTLKRAGMTVSIQPTPGAYPNSQAAEMSMMLGGNQNNNSDPMNQMLPYMMQAGTQEGAKSFSPQVMQAMMMNSMMNNMDFNTSNDR